MTCATYPNRVDLLFKVFAEGVHVDAEPELPECFKNFIQKHKLVFLGQGRHRVAYRTKSGNYVVKFPWQIKGNFDNMREAHISRKSKGEYCHYARCRCFDIDEHACLIMEYVTFPERYDNLPAWTDYIDCRQVGYNKKNELVAYDWA